MAVSHLIQRRSGIRIDRYGFLNPVRWFSSHSLNVEIEKSVHSKKRGVLKVERAVAAESFVKEYMEKNSGLFPKVAHIQNEVGGSWYTVKEIVTNIKATMTGTTRPENCHNISASTPFIHTAVSKVMTTPYELDSKTDLFGHQESSYEAETVRQGEAKGRNAELFTEMAVDPVSSNVTYTHGPSSSSDHDKQNFIGILGQQETSASCRPAARMQQGEEKEGNVEHSTRTAVDCLSSLRVDPGSSDVTSTHCPCSSSDHDKLNFTGIQAQQENSATYSLSHDSNVKMNVAVSSAPRGLPRMLNLFKFADHVTLPEGNNKKEEEFCGILSGLRLDKDPQGTSLLSPGILKGNVLTERPDLRENMSLSSSCENQAGQEMVLSREVNDTVLPVTESSTGSKNLTGLEGMKWLNTKTSLLGKNRDNSMPNNFRYLEEPMRKDETNRDTINDLKNLKDCVMRTVAGSSTATSKSKLIFPKTEESFEKKQLGSPWIASLHSFRKKERNLSEGYSAVHSESSHYGSSRVQTAGLRTQVAKISCQEVDRTTGHSQLSVLTNYEEPHETLEKSSIRKEAGEHKAVVKFLPRSAKTEDIVRFLKTCGDVQKVKFSSPHGAFFKDADVYFKEREGLLKALVKTDVIVNGVNVTVEAAGGEDISSRISIPSLIGDPDVPAAIVKNPTRTVKIGQLTREISLHDVVATLESGGNNVTGFFFGSMDSVAYVEFEEEDDKEEILERQSIDVLGKQLLVSRIDAPRTTCVRISFHKSELSNEIVKVCTSLGELMLSQQRAPGIVDVHYRIAEWPNMLKILNRLNGTEINGHKLQAQPATVIPPQILCILWRHPEEWIHVKNCVQKLLRKLGENIIHKADLADLHNFY